jgi:hypothetical protein
MQSAAKAPITARLVACRFAAGMAELKIRKGYLFDSKEAIHAA